MPAALDWAGAAVKGTGRDEGGAHRMPSDSLGQIERFGAGVPLGGGSDTPIFRRGDFTN